MHVPDGFVSPQLTVPAWAVSAPLWAWAARRHFGHSAAESLPVVGALTALAFVVQTIMVPLPGGTSTHLLGVTLLALLRGPLVAFVCESLVLAVQALFFGAGGFTVLGVNALAMGLLGPLAGWLVHLALRRLSRRAAAFLAAWVAVQVSTLAVALVLGLQHRLSATYFPAPLPVTLAAMMVPSLAVTGPAEGLYTLFALAILRRADVREAS
ncbi:energy-coupling factor ABC transporter permease [Anaeromyxobacter sp. Fw109-5]|uniref:energy-coupling factor ABC transporter permease n=1 Tax=Anaeromyxobacter sp. (strain Fw109-5) TaxID=404589 RepID=UPI0000ED73CA|nr:energy-coupling factor ABC transporter permease [Anaeromyxobacter sp. Fw109-5]ABS26507.1 cobalamin (vitamin B12) biosynthesis CbiM protein [Anaeromyxobacter sp. Fw109-5]